MGLYPELDDLSLDELTKKFSHCDSTEKFASSYLIEIALLIQSYGEKGVEFLLRELQNDKKLKKDAKKIRAAISGISNAAVANLKLERILLPFLNDHRVSIVAETIDGFLLIKEKSVFNKIISLQYSRSPYIRGSVLRYLSGLFPDIAISILMEALFDKSFIVRENAIDELDRLDATPAIPYLKHLLSDPYSDVRQAARTAIDNLS